MERARSTNLPWYPLVLSSLVLLALLFVATSGQHVAHVLFGNVTPHDITLPTTAPSASNSTLPTESTTTRAEQVTTTSLSYQQLNATEVTLPPGVTTGYIDTVMNAVVIPVTDHRHYVVVRGEVGPGTDCPPSGLNGYDGNGNCTIELVNGTSSTVSYEVIVS